MPKRGGLLGNKSGGRGRRRTVLQLGEHPREQSFGFGYQPPPEQDIPRQDPPVQKSANALGGLLSNYGESESDEDEEPPPPPEPKPKPKNKGILKMKMKFVAATTPSSTPPQEVSPAPPPVTATSTPESNGQEKTEVKDEIDAKVFDFLAEINADEEPQENGTSEEKTNGEDNTEVIKAGEGNGEPAVDIQQGDEEEEADSGDEMPEPTAPTTLWQHCLDDGTQCYYYWNIETNEVTWEIPPDYSQYLLQQKEYEERLLKFQTDQEARKNKPTKKKKRAKTEKSQEAKESLDIPTLTEDPPAETSVPSIISLVPYDETPEVVKTKSHLEIGPQLPSNFPSYASSEEAEPVSTQKGDTSAVSSSIEQSLPRESEIEWQSDYTEETKSETEPSDVAKPEKKTLPADDIDKASKILESLEKEFAKRTNKPVQFVEEIKAPAESFEAVVEEDEMDFDIDDIDQQLDLALERKTKSTLAADKVAEKSNKLLETLRSGKRAIDEDIPADSEQTVKKMKMNTVVEDNMGKGELNRSTAASIEDVGEMAELVSDKLAFLDVSSETLTKLQLILVETETRLSDWKEGAISTEYMLKKLKEANTRLEQYESTAAPPGWSCHFDRYGHFLVVVQLTCFPLCHVTMVTTSVTKDNYHWTDSSYVSISDFSISTPKFQIISRLDRVRVLT